MIAFKNQQILTQTAKKTDILANLNPPVTAVSYFLETQQCDHFQGSADFCPGSQKTDIFANFKLPITAVSYFIETQQCYHLQGSADTF